MRAWNLSADGEAYRYGEVDDPGLGPHDVAVRPVASALNHMDLWLLRGLPKPPSYPHVPGGDVAGVLTKIGSEVKAAWITEGAEVVINPSFGGGDRIDVDTPLADDLQILGEHRWGGHGDEVVVPATNVVPRPTNRTWEECAAYPITYVTAWRMLKRARLTSGESLLVIGVGGGVSTALVALGCAMGATVFGTSRSPAKRKAALALGAADVFDSNDSSWPIAVEVVADSVGPATWAQAIGSLRRGGRLVTCGGTSGRRVEVHLPTLFWNQHEIIGSSMGNHREFAEVTEQVGAGVAVPIDSTFALEEYPGALDRLAAGSQNGKVVLRHRSPR